MIRNIDFNEISDGKRYKNTDSVNLGCDGCKGRADCCKVTDDTILLDPYDIYSLELATGKDFSGLLSTVLDLRTVDGIITPYLKKNEKGACVFLDDPGRCKVHENRPGFCRLFPLGRIYEEGGFSYFLQKDECPCKETSPVKVFKWLGLKSLKEYEAYITKWHYFVTEKKDSLLSSARDEKTALENIKKLNMTLLQVFYVQPYNPESDFYKEFYRRIEELTSLLP